MRTILLTWVLSILMPISIFAQTQVHQDEEEKQEEMQKESTHEEGSVDISIESMKVAGIVVKPLALQNLKNELSVPAEVKLNAYLSSKVASRISAQVVSREAKLGDFVKQGQALVTLSSVAMAQAVGEFLLASEEWHRVQKLGESTVSSKRYNQARIAYISVRGKIMAYGMNDLQIEALKNSKTPKILDRFRLLAPKKGVIVSDDFIEGELIEPGQVLFDIVNESVLWIEAQLSPKQALLVEVGANVRIYASDDGYLQGKVVQKHHLLDEKTRTIGVRIQVSNEQDKLHPGMYVDVRIQTQQGKQYLALPTESLLRSADGDWVVFVEQDEVGEFKPIEVEVVKTINDHTVIKGLKIGARVVVKGAFFVQSELAKSGFSVHNH
ncbi:RND transporter [Bathymodiolus thermophilus thioautotrophic gill symbiont]|uniref:RND transporter n=1 Tax=Bathymodiolus thermophilus thioautotrophic gill symbiont TaxID=2360 RepID=A0A3G3IKW5_9GAMM|nr:efflux RND transporter periplasmic adaptor subunit [Bathymodiolus thermophilus thioautotrophic gill symbiont]AYQ56369.1 RND transporter [Bathymodiolus thermophilus thioautotrophic gill symbiont]